MAKIKNIALLNSNESGTIPETHAVVLETPEGLRGLHTGTGLDAQYIQPEERNGEYIFPVKFVFGEAKTNNPLITALYRTSIEVLNLSEHKEKFRTRISVSTLEQELVTKSSKQSLKHYQSIKYDLEAIRHRLRKFPEIHSADLIEGFLIIKTDCSQIKVMAVYTVFKQKDDLEAQPELTIKNEILDGINNESNDEIRIQTATAGKSEMKTGMGNYNAMIPNPEFSLGEPILSYEKLVASNEPLIEPLRPQEKVTDGEID